MAFEFWLAFAAASIIVLVIPGPTILTVVSYSLTQGRSGTIPLVAAVALGDSTALFFSLAGLGTLLATSAFWFTAIKVCGGVYLLYLGSRLLLAGKASADMVTALHPAPPWKLFANTYLVTALNPKGIIFFVAFLPQFTNPAEEIPPQLWLLAATFVVLATLNATFYAGFAGVARKVLSSPRNTRRFNIAGGSLLSVAGIWALFAKRLPG